MGLTILFAKNMTHLFLTIIIPTYNRPHLLPRAVESALGQTLDEIEVIVVDDASTEPVQLPEHPKLRVIRLENNQGISAVRNIGAKAARSRWITFLDDDDILLPHHAEVALKALRETTLPPPVAALSGMEVVTPTGQVLQTRIPPTLKRGAYFHLEDIPSDQSFLSKQTLVVERELLLGLGGYDEAFSSREHTELFLRLNPVCSLLGIPAVTYRQTAHQGARLSQADKLRQLDFARLLRKHKTVFQAHPQGFANFLYSHAEKSYSQGQPLAAFKALLWAIRLKPRHILGTLTWPYRNQLNQQFGKKSSVVLEQSPKIDN